LTNLSNTRHLTNCATFGKSCARLANRARDWPNAQRIWSILPTVTNANEIRQMRAHLANCAARLLKCAAHFKCAAHLVNPTDSDQMCTQFVKCACIWPIALIRSKKKTENVYLHITIATKTAQSLMCKILNQNFNTENLKVT